MNNTAKLGVLLPAVLNPATAALVGVAAIAVGIYRLLPDDEEPTVDTERGGGPERVALTAEQPLPAVELDDSAEVSVSDEAEPAPIPEADHKVIIRSAMSELGKRSAAARAKKKAERQKHAQQL